MEVSQYHLKHALYKNTVTLTISRNMSSSRYAASLLHSFKGHAVDKTVGVTTCNVKLRQNKKEHILFCFRLPIVICVSAFRNFWVGANEP